MGIDIIHLERQDGCVNRSVNWQDRWPEFDPKIPRSAKGDEPTQTQSFLASHDGSSTDSHIYTNK